jgi:hypothetical protein
LFFFKRDFDCELFDLFVFCLVVAIVGIVIGVVALLIGIGLLLVFFFIRRKNKQKKTQQPKPSSLLGQEKNTTELSEAGTSDTPVELPPSTNLSILYSIFL